MSFPKVEFISDDEEEGVDAVGFDDEDETFFSDLEEDASSTDDEITNVCTQCTGLMNIILSDVNMTWYWHLKNTSC